MATLIISAVILARCVNHQAMKMREIGVIEENIHEPLIGLQFCT